MIDPSLFFSAMFGSFIGALIGSFLATLGGLYIAFRYARKYYRNNKEKVIDLIKGELDINDIVGGMFS